MIGALLVAGASAVALGAVLVLWRSAFAGGLALQALGAVAIGATGFWVLASGSTLGAPFTSAFVPRLGVDGLSGFFLGVLGLVAAPAALFSRGYLIQARAAALSGPSQAGSSGARVRAVRARPADLPPRLGGDDAAPRCGDPRRPS